MGSDRHLETLGHALVDAFGRYADHPAAVIDGRTIGYSELGERAGAVARALHNVSAEQAGYVGILAARSDAACIGIPAALLAGHAYMPLSSRFPTSRLAHMLRVAECTLIVAGEECAATLAELARSVEELTVVCPSPGPALRDVAAASPQCTFVFLDPRSRQSVAPQLLRPTTPEDHAYLLFTSGTTGAPKGIAITHHNICAYLRYTIDRYGVAPSDRLSQMFDLTFDLSVHDLFVGLLSGAAVHVVPGESVMAPAKFIKDNELTLWFSVPSVPMFMARMRMLKSGAFPSLRCSLFCGEALPQRTAEMWQAAAPNGILENLYGPTETTIAIMNYRWDPERSPEECVNGVVPIGRPFRGHATRIVDDDGNALSEGQSGELCLAGPQVAPGYLKDPERTASSFVRFEDDPGTIWYRTGDVARREANGCAVYLGRTDDQVQIRGFRVELQEIDEVIRNAAGIDLAVAVPKDLSEGRAESIVAVVQGAPDASLKQTILSEARNLLPDYMVPADVRFIASMPLNANGKIDRKSLVENLHDAR